MSTNRMGAKAFARGVIGLIAAAGGANGQCVPSWTPGFWVPPAANGVDNTILAMTTYDDGTGEALYAGGRFTLAGSAAVHGIAKWDGTAWSDVGGGVGGSDAFVAALAVYSPDINPPRLVAGGTFSTAGGFAVTNIADWNGSFWRPLGLGITGNSGVACLCVHDGRLYAGGSFTHAGGVASNFVSRWDGTDWIWPGGASNGTSGAVNAMAVFGGALYMGGAFPTAGMNLNAQFVARWTGTTWVELANGLNSTVDALATFDDGTGAALYVGGNFTSASGGPALAHIARWNGAAWSAVAGGINGRVRALAVHDDGNGPALYAGGDFFAPGGGALTGIAKWSPGAPAWAPLGMGLVGRGQALAAFDDDRSGPLPAALYVSGNNVDTGGNRSYGFSRWGCSICYANCDGSTGAPVLNVNDFVCFQGRFAAGDSYANCDGSTTMPVLNVNDFVCFQSRFAGGCR